MVTLQRLSLGSIHVPERGQRLVERVIPTEILHFYALPKVKYRGQIQSP